MFSIKVTVMCYLVPESVNIKSSWFNAFTFLHLCPNVSNPYLIYIYILTPVHSCETTTPSIHGNTSLLEPKQKRPRDAFTAFLNSGISALVSDSVWFTFIYYFPKAKMEVETARPYFFGDIGKSTRICRVVRTAAAACCHILIIIFHTIVLFLMSCSCSQQPMSINVMYDYENDKH